MKYHITYNKYYGYTTPLPYLGVSLKISKLDKNLVYAVVKDSQGREVKSASHEFSVGNTLRR